MQNTGTTIWYVFILKKIHKRKNSLRDKEYNAEDIGILPKQKIYYIKGKVKEKPHFQLKGTKKWTHIFPNLLWILKNTHIVRIWIMEQVLKIVSHIGADVLTLVWKERILSRKCHIIKN